MLPQKPTCASRTNVSQLAERLGMSQPTVSHHLRILRQAGFVEYTKHCRDCYYWRDPAAVEAVGLDAEDEPPGALRRHAERPRRRGHPRNLRVRAASETGPRGYAPRQVM